MAECMLCFDIERELFPEELPNQYFCGCQYESAARRASKVRMQKQIKVDKESTLHKILAEAEQLNSDNVHAQNIKNIIRQELNIKSCQIVDI